jgi:molybdopterin-synthase adenylyltransferase
MNKINGQLTEKEKERYQRQIIFPEWGNNCQERLKKSKIFIAGAGGLGSPVSIYLAIAGVGHIIICDKGEPELSNLNRQILHDDSRIGVNKSLSARDTLLRLNPDITVEPAAMTINFDTVEKIIGHVDVIVDCLDNFETRHILNQYAVKHRIPMVHGGVYGMNGQITFIRPPETPCLWCIHPGTLPTVVFPIIGATAGVIGSLQALEVIKYLAGIGTNLINRMLIWDGCKMKFEEIIQKKMQDCPVCGK